MCLKIIMEIKVCLWTLIILDVLYTYIKLVYHLLAQHKHSGNNHSKMH